MRELIKVLVLLGLSLSLTACGFALRGSDVLSSKYDVVRLNSINPNGDFSRALVRSLENAGVTVEMIDSIDNLDDSLTSPVLMISDEQSGRRAITVNPRARAAQYELTLMVQAAFGQGQTLHFGPEPLSVQKVYFEDIENISGSQEEIEIISDEMRRELVSQLIRRLEAIPAVTVTSTAATPQPFISQCHYELLAPLKQ